MRWRLCELFVLFLLTWKSSGTSLTLNNKYLPGKVLRKIEHSSLFDCSALCDEDSKCLSFNFFASTLECELNSNRGRDEDLIDKKRSYFSNKKTTNTSPCSKLNCIESHVCHVNRGDNPPTCVRRAADLKSDVTHNCYDVMRKNLTDGVYTLTAPKLKVYCDMTTDCGGWLVFQRKIKTPGIFKNKKCKEYMDGFGDVNESFWFGNEKIHQITSNQSYELRVDMEDKKGNKGYAVYSTFLMDSKKQKYRLHIGQCTGHAGDSADNFCPAKNHDVSFFNGCNLDTIKRDNFLKDLLQKTWGEKLSSFNMFQMMIRPTLN